MSEGESKQPVSNVRQGLALVCVGAIGATIGLVGRDQDTGPFDGGRTVGEQIAEIVGGFGLLFVLLGLAFVAWGLLRD